MPKFSGLVEFLLLLIILTVDCSAADENLSILGQPAIAFSDEENTLVFSVVESGPTVSQLTFELYDLDKELITAVTNQTTRSYSTHIDGEEYSRTAHFFSAQVVRGHKYSWSVIANNTLGPYHFKLRDYNTSLDTRMIVIADIDLSESAEPTWQALRELELTSYNGIIGLGDLSYSIDDENGLRGDNFFNVFAEFSTKVPVILIAGNHEKYDHFRLFNYRFRMPQYNPDWDNNVYTVLENNALFLFVNFDFILKGPIELYKQTLLYTQSLLEQWKDDRRVRWRVFSSHRTLSCGRIEHYSCRTNLIFFKPFDDLLRKHTFDLYLADRRRV